MSHAITVDKTDSNRVTGWVEYPEYGDDFPVWGTRKGRRWYVYAGLSDEYKAVGSTLAIAIRRLASEIGVTGTVLIGDDATFTEEVWDLTTGKRVK